MTEHEPVPGTEYFNQHDNYTVPEDVMKELQEFTQKWEKEEMLEHAWPEDQYEDEEEMAQWYEFDAYQDFTDETAIYPDENAQEYVMYGLMSEVGEMAGKMKKELRDGTPFYTDDFVKELGDVLWYVAQLASIEGICLSDVARINVDKLKSRKARDVIKGDGDDR